MAQVFKQVRSVILIFVLLAAAASVTAQEQPGNGPTVNTATVAADPGQAQFRRDLLAIEEAMRRLESLSQRREPARLDEREKRAWLEQSRRLARHAATLQDLVDDMITYLDGEPDADERTGLRARARGVTHRLQSRVEAYNNAAGHAAETRQQMAQDALAGAGLR